MTGVLQIPDHDGLYATISAAPWPKDRMRSTINRLGRTLARAVREYQPDPAGQMLCVVILRGGALLYPSFVAEFSTADFCMLGLRRVDGTVSCEYRTTIPSQSYDRVVYLDCIAATGSTILEAHRAVTEACEPGAEMAAVICSATTATDALQQTEVTLIGFSLHETETSGIVAPDLGKLDAGDLFTGNAGTPAHPWQT